MNIPFWLQKFYRGTYATPFVAIEIYHSVAAAQRSQLPLPILLAVAYVIAHKFHSVSTICTKRAVCRVAAQFSIDVEALDIETLEVNFLVALNWKIPTCSTTVWGKIEPLLAFAEPATCRRVFKITSNVLSTDFSAEHFAIPLAALATICVSSQSVGDAKLAIKLMGQHALKHVAKPGSIKQ